MLVDSRCSGRRLVSCSAVSLVRSARMCVRCEMRALSVDVRAQNDADSRSRMAHWLARQQSRRIRSQRARSHQPQAERRRGAKTRPADRYTTSRLHPPLSLLAYSKVAVAQVPHGTQYTCTRTHAHRPASRHARRQHRPCVSPSAAKPTSFPRRSGHSATCAQP
jgi:hypothetical protein